MSTTRHNIARSTSGFTMLETIAVLLLVAILAAFIMPRLTSTTAYTLAGETDTLKGHLRYAQLRAMNDTVPWTMAITEAGYSLQKNGNPANLPGENAAIHVFANGVVHANDELDVSFDSWGNPGTTEDIVIRLVCGHDHRVITITTGTGYIP